MARASTRSARISARSRPTFCLKRLVVDLAFAEPDYTRPMTLGFSLEYQKHSKIFELAEGVIKDRLTMTQTT